MRLLVDSGACNCEYV